MSIVHDVKARLAAIDTSALRRFAENVATGVKWLGRKPRTRGYHVMSIGATSLPVAAALAVSALILFALFVDIPGWSHGLVWAIDSTAIRLARHLPERVVVVFNELTDFGKSGWFLWPTGVAMLAIAAIAAAAPVSRMSRLVLASIAVRLEFLFVAVAVPGIFTNIVKILFGRGRPFVGNTDVYIPFDTRAAFASLPSGHATTAFSVLVAFGVLFPALRPYLWAYAIIIAVSRVVVLAHHPTDVLAGAVVGALGAFLIRNVFAVRRLGFTVDKEGSVNAMPGPSWTRIKTVARSIVGP